MQLALVDEGRKSVILDIAGYPPGERVKNQIGAREALPKQYGDAPEYTLVVARGDTDIKPVPAIKLEARIRRAHSLIWAGGRRDPLVALLLLVSSARGSWCFYFCSACSSATTTPKEFSICWVDDCRAAS